MIWPIVIIIIVRTPKCILLISKYILKKKKKLLLQACLLLLVCHEIKFELKIRIIYKYFICLSHLNVLFLFISRLLFLRHLVDYKFLEERNI